MTLDDILPDTIMALTAELKRLFEYAGCDPACHACDQPIEVGQDFKLATHRQVHAADDVEIEDVMLCAACTIWHLNRANARFLRSQAEEKRNKGGYSRPSRGRK